MKRTNLMIIASLLLAFVALSVGAETMVGDKAPGFTAMDSHGKTQKLSDYNGKIVVLEWFNVGCPFTKKHYNSGNMQALQKKYTDKGVVWFSVSSSGPGKQGYLTLENVKDQPLLKNAAATAVLLDGEGKLGHLFGAKTTPHLFIIDKDGTVVYNGAIDSIRSANPDDVAQATNYVAQALDGLLAGKSVSMKKTQPYGCSVKYKD